MKAKKIVISLSIALTAVLAVVVGVLAFNKGGKTEPQIFAQPHNQGAVSSEFKPTTYYFDEGEVNIVDGTERLVYSYDVNQKASAPIAYEYIFANTVNKEMAVNVKEVVADGAIVSYHWSDTELEEITETSSHFITQPIGVNETKYLYVVLTPEDENVSTIVDTTVRWNYGEAGNITKIHTVSGLPFTQTYIKNTPIKEEDMLLPNMEEGYAFGGWYWDEDYTQPVNFPLAYSGKPMYARVGALLPDDWFGTDTSSSTRPYYLKYGVVKSGSPILGLKSRDVIIPEIHNGQEVELINVALTGASNVKIPSTVEYFNHAFNGNNYIRKAFIPKSVKYIEQVFQNCTNLEEVVFEEVSQLTTIGSSTFSGCIGITSVDIPSSVTQIGGSAFSASGLTEIAIPSGVTQIGSSVFSNCKNLTNVNFNNCTSLTTISDRSFGYCSSLTEITIPASVTSIGGYAFRESGIKNMNKTLY